MPKQRYGDGETRFREMWDLSRFDGSRDEAINIPGLSD